eukprot:664009-Pelagomonas_calceolata.AAC.7
MDIFGCSMRVRTVYGRTVNCVTCSAMTKPRHVQGSTLIPTRLRQIPSAVPCSKSRLQALFVLTLCGHP